MPTSQIYFFTEDILFELPDQVVTARWIQQVIIQEGAQLIHLNFVFCSDAYLHAQNVRYLQHDTLTDVITFIHHEEQDVIEGDVYISIERVRENAAIYAVVFGQELYRVMIHGVLHLLGYGDDTAAEKAQIREKEDFYIAARENNQ
jgi:rRNA maturation RNase YbeY